MGAHTASIVWTCSSRWLTLQYNASLGQILKKFGEYYKQALLCTCATQLTSIIMSLMLSPSTHQSHHAHTGEGAVHFTVADFTAFARPSGCRDGWRLDPALSGHLSGTIATSEPDSLVKQASHTVCKSCVLCYVFWYCTQRAWWGPGWVR